VAVILDVFGDNFFHVFFRLWSVPNIVGVNYHGWTLGAGIQTSCFVNPDLPFQAEIVDAAFHVV